LLQLMYSMLIEALTMFNMQLCSCSDWLCGSLNWYYPIGPLKSCDLETKVSGRDVNNRAGFVRGVGGFDPSRTDGRPPHRKLQK